MLKSRDWLVLVFIGFSGCKTTSNEPNVSEVSLKDLNRFECVDHLRPFSQGHATVYEWPTSFSQVEAGSGTPYTYALVTDGKANKDGSALIFLEDNLGKLYRSKINEGGQTKCQDFPEMTCVRFNLPFANSPMFATRYQIFENESLITIHDLVGENNKEFENYTKVSFETIPIRPLVVDDIKLRLSRVKDTVEILLMNQDEAYAKEIVGESEKIKVACQKVIE